VAALLALGIVLATSSPPAAAAGSSQQLQQQISSGQRRVSSLAGAVAGADQRLNQLTGAIASLTGQLKGFQSSLTTKENDLLALRSQLSAAQLQLSHAQAADEADEQALSEQLVGTYEGDTPDIVTVVLEATGFDELLDGLNFVSRVGEQDAKVAGAVKAARRHVAAQAIRLGALSARRQRLLGEMQSAADRVATERVNLVSQELAAAKLRSAKAGELAGVKDSVASLTARLAEVQAAAQRAAGQTGQASSGAGGTGSRSSGSGSGAGSASGTGRPSAPSSHGFEFPMPKSDVSPPDTWSLDDGVDISAPGGTPELAVCSGTIVLHGIGGFGPSAPVLHCDSPLAGYDEVYYGHAGPGDWTPIGTHVSQGQIISEVGYGDVGISTGPHLEIGFADSSGSPVGPSSAPTMMSLLRAAYGV
jgi:murein DD-endopeptidase MepM/ murein hydrolase activator NlpD